VPNVGGMTHNEDDVRRHTWSFYSGDLKESYKGRCYKGRCPINSCTEAVAPKENTFSSGKRCVGEYCDSVSLS